MNGQIVGRLSAYALALSTTDRQRYVNKIREIGFVDPYVAKLNQVDFPKAVTTGHVVDYLLQHPGNVRNMRSIEAYKKFEAGFLSDVAGGVFNGLHVVRGKVKIFLKNLFAPHILYMGPSNYDAALRKEEGNEGVHVLKAW